MKEFVINENDAGQRVDKYIQKTTNNMPKSLMYRLIRQKKIKVNRKRCEVNQQLMVGDSVQMFIADEFFQSKELPIYQAKKLESIIYEDQNLLIVNKEVGVFSHSDSNHTTDTMIQRILRYLIETGQYDPNQENSFIPGIVNRLDANTGGLMIACKNAKTLRRMNEAIKNNEIEKHYLCIVLNGVKDGRYDHYYKKDEKSNKAFIYDSHVQGSVRVSLSVKTLCTGKKYSLEDIHLITGKSHQIRAQMAHLGFPLIGDKKYGGNSIMKHQALAAYKLIFHLNDDEFAYLNQNNIIYLNNFVQKKFEQLEGIEVNIK